MSEGKQSSVGDISVDCLWYTSHLLVIKSVNFQWYIGHLFAEYCWISVEWVPYGFFSSNDISGIDSQPMLSEVLQSVSKVSLKYRWIVTEVSVWGISELKQKLCWQLTYILSEISTKSWLPVDLLLTEWLSPYMSTDIPYAWMYLPVMCFRLSQECEQGSILS